MEPRIEIDLNVRIGQTLTFAGFEDVYGCEPGDLEDEMPVTVCESESGVNGVARIVGIDHDKRLVYLELEWRSLSRNLGSCGQ